MDYVSSSSLSLSLIAHLYSPSIRLDSSSMENTGTHDRGARLNCPGITAIYLEGGREEGEKGSKRSGARRSRRRSAVDQTGGDHG